MSFCCVVALLKLLSLDNDVAAPLYPVVLAQAIDLPIPPSLEESSEKPSAVSTTGGTTRRSSTSTDATSKTGLAIKSGEAQKKLSKFFKNLGPSMFVRSVLLFSCADQRTDY